MHYEPCIHPQKWLNDDRYDDCDVYCAACGVPLDKPCVKALEDIPWYAWWGEVMAFRYVKNDGNPTAQLETYTREEIQFPTWRDLPERGVHNSMDESPYVALHVRCYEILGHIVDHRRSYPIPEGPRTLEDFWTVFQSRMDEDLRHYYSYISYMFDSAAQFRILEPHSYYFGDDEMAKYCTWPQWPFGHPDIAEFEIQPMPIPDLSQRILAFLKPLPETIQEQDPTSFERKLSQLPAELMEEILDYLHPSADLSLACTRDLSPAFWRELLFTGRLFPWLWDLDAAALLETRTSDGRSWPPYTADNFWDWEQLVRQLSRVETFKPGNPMSEAPLELRNRRRIWRLLDEARKNDIEEYARHRKREQHFKKYGMY